MVAAGHYWVYAPVECVNDPKYYSALIFVLSARSGELKN